MRTAPFGSNMDNKINIEGIPELGLSGRKLPAVIRPGKVYNARNSSVGSIDDGDDVR